MAKKNDASLGELIVLLIIGWLAYQLTFGTAIYEAGHQAFVKMGVDEVIHEWDREIQNR